MTGVFISKGMTFAIKKGGLKLNLKDGKIATSLTPSVSIDLCPIWLNLSVQHLEKARQWRNKRKSVWLSANEDLKADTLEREFEHSMQAIISMAIAYDSFYGTIKNKINLPQTMIDAWKKNRTARYIRISETLKQAFIIRKKGNAILRQAIKEIFRFRDMAIHPTGDLEYPVMHPELGVAVEWRFQTFSYMNANMIVQEGLRRLMKLAQFKKVINKQIETYCPTFLELINPILKKYEGGNHQTDSSE